MLFLHASLQLYDENSEDAAAVATDLLQCQAKLLSKSDESSIDASVVIVDILLNFLSKSSGLLRAMATRVFSYLVAHISTSAFSRILEVIEQDSVLEEDGASSDDEDDGDSDGSDNDSDDNSEEV